MAVLLAHAAHFSVLPSGCKNRLVQIERKYYFDENHQLVYGTSPAERALKSKEKFQKMKNYCIHLVISAATQSGL